tara:strand:+ start:660 stop:1802 length:1143 start_codon:yes stop_codon:yes gene_type:complete
MKIPFARPLIDVEERKIANDVLKGHVLVHGPRISKFENDFSQYVGTKKAVAVSSCTAGLHLSYFYLGIGPGDEVIVPAMTHVATAHAVEYMNAKPIFVDSDPKTGNIDISKLENAITSKTKAISVVHFLGLPVDMDKINKIAKKYSLFVVEDCALAFGAKYKGVHTGLLGDIGVFSMYPVKHITTLEGGLIISKRTKILDQIRYQRAFGVDRTHSERKVPGEYDVKYLGFNYRMNELQAAIGSVQLKKLSKYIDIRKANYDTMTSILKSNKYIKHLDSGDVDKNSSYYCKTIILQHGLENKRTEVINDLAKKGIGTSIYYPRPVPILTYYKNKYGYSELDFPEAYKISNNSIALPVAPHLKSNDAEYIAKEVMGTINNLL